MLIPFEKKFDLENLQIFEEEKFGSRKKKVMHQLLLSFFKQ